MNNLSKILNLMERIDKDYHQYTMLINEDKRGKAAKNACYNVFRQYFNNASFLDREFVHQDNPEHLSAIDYMYKQFMDAFYHDPATRAGAVMRLAPMFLRLALESGFQQGHEDANKLNRLRNILNYIHQANKTKGLDISQISVNTTFDELNNAFGKEIDNQNASMKDRINNGVYDENNNFNGYKIVGPLTFEEANKYGNASCPDSKLCYTQGYNTWNRYSAEGINNVYVLLRDGWENVPPEHDDESNSAYDTYGLSMIFVFVDGHGDLAYCNTRWNHSAKYKSGSSCDHALNEEEISQLIGRNFYSVFKPNNKWNELVEDALTRIKNGEDPKKVFDNYYPSSGQLSLFQLRNKWNFIDREGNLLSPNQWFDDASKFYHGVSRVYANDKFNLLRDNGSYILNEWVDDIGYFSSDYATIRNKGKSNFINLTNGQLISDQWFDDAYGFDEGFGMIELNNKWNFFNVKGQLISDQWFDDAYPYEENFGVLVSLNGAWNFMNVYGKFLLSKWFDRIFVIAEGEVARIKEDDLYNCINPNGNILSKIWFDEIHTYEDGYALVKLDGECNFIDTNGNLLSPNQWFDDAQDFCNNHAQIMIDGYTGIINTNGAIEMMDEDELEMMDGTMPVDYDVFVDFDDD